MNERIINFIESADGSVSLVTLTREEAETAIAAILAARDRPGPSIIICPHCNCEVALDPAAAQQREGADPKHRPEWIDDVPTGFCECGLRAGHAQQREGAG